MKYEDLCGVKENIGCCQIRNRIAHGGISKLSNALYWNLRGLIRSAILKVGDLVLSSQIDKEQYYESLNKHVDNRFQGNTKQLKDKSLQQPLKELKT